MYARTYTRIHTHATNPHTYTTHTHNIHTPYIQTLSIDIPYTHNTRRAYKYHTYKYHTYTYNTRIHHTYVYHTHIYHILRKHTARIQHTTHKHPQICHTYTYHTHTTHTYTAHKHNIAVGQKKVLAYSSSFRCRSRSLSVVVFGLRCLPSSSSFVDVVSETYGRTKQGIPIPIPPPSYTEIPRSRQ